MTKRKSKGAYMISAVAEVPGISPQTLQLSARKILAKKGPVDPGPLFCLLLGLSWR